MFMSCIISPYFPSPAPLMPSPHPVASTASRGESLSVHGNNTELGGSMGRPHPRQLLVTSCVPLTPLSLSCLRTGEWEALS